MSTPRNFKIFAVGGHVRDSLLDIESKDLDIVVVGATIEDFMRFGEKAGLHFKQVGADFPVFLDTFGREWAFARKERKVGPGYHGFEVECDPDVTLEEDLFRRDLTINAMAKELFSAIGNEGNFHISEEIIDPFNGQEDLKNGVLRHVSEHFAEDPVRVLRIARFAARYGFDVAESTVALINQMATSGELDHLVPERVWAEMEKAIMEPNPQRFFHVLDATSALDVIFPELSNVTKFWDIHRGLDSFERFSLLGLSMGLQAHHMFNRLKAPTDLTNFIFKLVLLMNWLKTNEVTPETAMWVFKTNDCFRDKDFLKKAFWTVNNLSDDDDKVHQLVIALPVALDVMFESLTDEQRNTLKGPEIGQAIDNLRLEAIRNM